MNNVGIDPSKVTKCVDIEPCEAAYERFIINEQPSMAAEK